MNEPLAPLDSALSRLLDVERHPIAPPAAGKDRVRARLARSIPLLPGGGGGGGGSATVGGGSRALARTAATFALGAVLGGAALHVLREPRVVYVDRVVSASATTTNAAVSVETLGIPPPLPTVATATPIASLPSVASAPGRPAPASSSSASQGSLAKERAVLEPARAALAHGDAAAALEAIGRHEREHANGALVEEREALAVQALAKAHRMDEARARGARFKARYPASMFGAVIDATLGSGP